MVFFPVKNVGHSQPKPPKYKVTTRILTTGDFASSVRLRLECGVDAKLSAAENKKLFCSAAAVM
jgi:hypothetical protein